MVLHNWKEPRVSLKGENVALLHSLMSIRHSLSAFGLALAQSWQTGNVKENADLPSSLTPTDSLYLPLSLDSLILSPSHLPGCASGIDLCLLIWSDDFSEKERKHV